jgi:hypothetical protein
MKTFNRAIVLSMAIVTLQVFAAAPDADKPNTKFPKRPNLETQATAEQVAEIKKLVAQLGDDAFDVRSKAQAALKAIGPAALKDLRSARTAAADPEVVAAITKIVAEQESEVWDGYFWYTLDPIETAIKSGETPTHFWFNVKRDDNGSFTAECDEEGGGGTASISGAINRETGEFHFNKAYNQGNMRWRYEGKWNPEKGRIEGTFGPGQGGFALYPHKKPLTEIK